MGESQEDKLASIVTQAFWGHESFVVEHCYLVTKSMSGMTLQSRQVCIISHSQTDHLDIHKSRQYNA